MKAAGEAAWTNATHLVVAEPGHPRMGSFLRGADLGWAKPADADEMGRRVRGAPGRRHAGATHRRGRGAAVRRGRRGDARRTARPARWPCAAPCGCCARRRKTLDEYAALCGVPADKIAELARRFTSYGKRAVADAHGGTMSGAGFYTAYAIAMLNTLVGNLNVEGGLVLDAGPFPPRRGPTLQHRRLRQPRHAQGRGPVAQSLPYEKSSDSSARRRRASRPIRPPRPGIRPPADSARKCWPRRWRATRTAPRSGSTT